MKLSAYLATTALARIEQRLGNVLLSICGPHKEPLSKDDIPFLIQDTPAEDLIWEVYYARNEAADALKEVGCRD